jgi:type VI secretion system protein ImpL
VRRVFTSWWFWTGLAVAIIVALLLFGLPLVVHFMRPWWVRIAFCVGVVAIWLTIAFFRWRRARRANAAIAEELTKTDPADEEEKALGQRMKTAIASLRSSGGLRRNYLYSRPWYVIIGPPGAGKTTAILNSGLRFPYAEQSLEGVGGTRNLDFWFAEEAVLVDTAGRYTTQESDHAVDARGWQSFLGLLRKYRPLQPINGVIIAIGVDELIRSDRARIDDHAAAIRRRLLELRKSLEVEAPVYLMVTKADLVAGFTEYFADLDFEGRRAVLGSTVPFKRGRASAEDLAKAFDRMAQSVTDRQAKRLYEEPDSQRRSLILGFPAQLQSLRARLMRLVDGAFLGGDAPGGVLRGFYLTSGVQEGAPLDRILSGMADVYDRPVHASGQGSGGKAYFLNRLMAEVMFTEAGLVQMEPTARVRQRVRLTAAIGVIAAISLLTLVAWSISFSGNRKFQAAMLDQAGAAHAEAKQAGLDLVEVRDTDPDLEQAIPVLDALRNLPYGYEATRTSGVPLRMRAGLFQSGLAESGQETYREGLRRIMLPRLLLRLEKIMQANRNDPMSLYEPLKVYLMLGGQGPMDQKAVRNWVTSDWENELYAGSDRAPTRAALARHLDALLDDKELGAAWASPPLNGSLVSDTRSLLQTLSPADRAYAVLKQKASLAGAPWAMTGILTPGDAKAFAQPDAVLAAKVPYFYTRGGFEKYYTIGLTTVQRDIAKDAWVLGSKAASVAEDIANIRPGVAGLYARDYNDAWEKVIALLKPADYFTDRVAFGAFTREPSPLERVLLEVRRNTTFTGGAAEVARREAARRFGSTRVGQMVSSYSEGRETGIDAGGAISSHFAELNEYVGDGKSDSSLREFVAAVKQAGDDVYSAREAVASGAATDELQTAMAKSSSSVKNAAGSAPAQLQGFVKAAAGSGARAQVNTVTGAVATSWQEAGDACKGVADQRYPFFGASSEDAPMLDMLRIFGPGGTLTSYVDQHLKPLIDMKGPLWRWREDNPVTAGFNPDSPEEFAKAAKIRDLLTSGLPLRVTVEQFGSDTGSVEISSGNGMQRLDHDTQGQRVLSWSAQGNPEASVTMYPPEPETPPPQPVPAPASAPTASAAGQNGAAAQPAPPPAPPAPPPPPPARISAEGPWAFFRLMDKADKQNAGPQTIRATFRSGPHWVTLLIQLPTGDSPFGRGGMWTFRCPAAL